MNDKRTNPVLNRPNRGQDSREFLKNLEDLMRRNKGSFGAMAFDVGSNKPYRVGGRVLQPNQETPSISWRPGSPDQPIEMPQRQYIEFDQFQIPEFQAEPLSMPEAPPLSDNPTPNEMLDAIFREAWTPSLPTTEQLEYRYQQTGETYPVMSNVDGTVTYNDGSIHARDPQEPPMPIASMADGTVLWSDGFTRQMPPGGLAQYLAGVSGLSQFIFGQDQAVTQDYGNYNPNLYASGYHQGVDFRTRDLQVRNLFAPVPMRVVQVISADSGSAYGNSVLLELPSGEMIRLSHLDSFGQFEEGQVLNPGDLIGLPGNTGNSTGEHLDVEFYDVNGQLANPNTFTANVSNYSIANEITGVSPYLQPQTRSDYATQSTQAPAVGSTLVDAVERWNPTGEIGVGATELARGDVLGAQTELANTIDTLNPTGQFDLGITERLQGDQTGANQALSNTIAQVGQQYNIPETGISEAAEEGGFTGALRQLAGNTLDVISSPFKQLGVPDIGLSEYIAGGPTMDTGRDFIGAQASGNMSKVPQRSDYSQVLGENISDVGRELGAKAGEGLNALKQAGSGIKNLIGKGIQTLTPKREVGEQSSQVAQQAGQTAQMSSTQPKNDIRDPFFKMGGAQMYSKYLAPDAENRFGGALTLDLFSPDFFKSADNVANVFGGSFMGKEATDKYRQNETNRLPMSSFTPMTYQDYGYGEGAWSDDYRSQVDKVNQENRSKVDQYNQAQQAETDRYNTSISDYLKSIPSVLTSAFSFADRQKPTSERVSLGTVKKSSAEPKMGYAVNQPQMSFSRSTPQQSVVRQPQMSMVNAPQMSFARNAPQMSVAPMMSMARPMTLAAPKAPEKPKPRPSLADYLRMGKTVAQYYAETGQQSTMDDLGKKGYDARSNVDPYDMQRQQMSISPSGAVNIAIQAGAAGQTATTPAGNPLPNYTPINANMSDRSTGLPVVGQRAPYPIATMADGRIRYSDGSIR